MPYLMSGLVVSKLMAVCGVQARSRSILAKEDMFSRGTLLSLMYAWCPELVVHLLISERGRCDRRKLGLLVVASCRGPTSCCQPVTQEGGTGSVSYFD